MNEHIGYELRAQAAWITLQAPQNHNTLNLGMTEALTEGMRRADGDPAVRAIVLTGTGPTFCAGADLKGGGGRTFGGARPTDQAPFAELMEVMWNASKPIIGRVQGNCYGGGVTMVAACDVAVAVETARFTLTEVRYGLVPAYICVLFAHKQLLGSGKQMILTGETLDASKALAVHLVHRVVPPQGLDAGVQETLDNIAACGPGAIAQAKRFLRDVPHMGFADSLRAASAVAKAQFEGPEGQQGMAAFKAKQIPDWSK
ncbi:MAG: enoyl-CoA hydratase/isomerase family protein [Candidatus Lambdaproteobacteria bacterium]|nr:enoyl-CoA hydratase/isomerase family protein [Candidatus Lambdaproteobacteria bacterium]